MRHDVEQWQENVKKFKKYAGGARRGLNEEVYASVISLELLYVSLAV